MHAFPRTMIEGLSLPRLIIGTNWMLGFSHSSRAKDTAIVEGMTSERIADILEVFIRGGVDALLGFRVDQKLEAGIQEAEQRTGARCIKIATPGFALDRSQKARDDAARTLDQLAQRGTSICMPHQSTTDAFANRRTKSLEGIEPFLAMIRERGMIPGLSTHMPEVPGYADETGLDVATYIQIYNAIGFLMQVELDWVQRVIWNARKPVITIKPLAAGRLMPLPGLSFVWNTIRPVDMAGAGTNTPDEAAEMIELSHAVLEHRLPHVMLQETRSKESLRAAPASEAL